MTDKDKPKPPHRAATHISDDLKVERISKIMARAGVASRRDCERLIMEGRVRLNGTLLESPAITCTLADSIEVDNMPIRGIERTRLWLYNKPSGLVTTNYDPEGRPTVFENLPEDLPRVLSIGRLDINTEGLLLLTNDGGLARVLELPATGWLRRYRVRAHGSITQAKLDGLREGIAVDGVVYGPIEATLDREQGHNVWITMAFREGKNREIKNVLGALGLDVNRLIRISYGPFQLGELADGDVQEVRSRMLRDQLGPRLIEEAKANFEAPILTTPKVEAPSEPEPPVERREREGRSFREKPEDRREQALARFETKRPDFSPRGERPDRERPRDERKQQDWSERARPATPERGRGSAPERGRNPDRDRDQRGDKGEEDRPKRPPLGTIRTANIWKAPGARPVASEKDRPADDVMSAGKRVTVAYKEKTPELEKPGRPVKKPRGRAKPFDANARNESKSFGGKPPGRAKPAFEGGKPYEGKPREGRSEGRSFDKPRSAQGEGGSERSLEPRAARAAFEGAKPYEGKPREGRAEGRAFDKPRDSKPGYKKSSTGGKPGGKPSGAPGGRPTGGKSSGGKGVGRGADRRR